MTTTSNEIKKGQSIKNNNFLKELEKYFESSSRTQILEDWEKTRSFDNIKSPLMSECVDYLNNIKNTHTIDIDVLNKYLKEPAIRLNVYELAIIKYGKNIPFIIKNHAKARINMCYYIHKSIRDLLGVYYLQKSIHEFYLPELHKRKPYEKSDNGIWWDSNDYKTRIQIFREMIIELKKEIQK